MSTAWLLNSTTNSTLSLPCSRIIITLLLYFYTTENFSLFCWIRIFLKQKSYFFRFCFLPLHFADNIFSDSSQSLSSWRIQTRRIWQWVLWRDNCHRLNLLHINGTIFGSKTLTFATILAAFGCGIIVLQ